MGNLYEWLFGRCALPKPRNIELEHFKALDAFAERTSLSQTERLCLLDMMGSMHLAWGTEAFALGVRFGLRLYAPRAKSPKPDRLLDFLPQLDDPVS